MKTLYEASNAVEAHMLLDILKQEGLTAQIQGEHLQGAIGELPASGLVRLVINESEYMDARAAISRWEKAQPESTPLERPHTSYRGVVGFALGLLFGIGGTYAAYRAPATTDGIDFNRDGLLDEKWTYSANGTPIKLEVDRNLDRKVDYIARYDSRGLISTAESDDNFDGVFETKMRFRDNNLELTESDTDGDGFIDRRWHYFNGVLESVEFVNPSTGLPLRLEHIKLGHLVSADVDTDNDGKLDTKLNYGPLGEVVSREPLAR